MTTVRHLLQNKAEGLWTISPGAMVIDGLKLMAEKNIGALIVVEGEQLAGIFSERDYARKIILKGRFSHDTTVKDIMTSDVVSVKLDQSIEECMMLLSNYRIRHLPVVENEKLIGIISIGDVVKALLTDKESTIKHLENYITGAR
ncbi:MAG: CBS domain-containing protein [bacterium]